MPAGERGWDGLLHRRRERPCGRRVRGTVRLRSRSAVCRRWPRQRELPLPLRYRRHGRLPGAGELRQLGRSRRRLPAGLRERLRARRYAVRRQRHPALRPGRQRPLRRVDRDDPLSGRRVLQRAHGHLRACVPGRRGLPERAHRDPLRGRSVSGAERVRARGRLGLRRPGGVLRRLGRRARGRLPSGLRSSR